MHRLTNTYTIVHVQKISIVNTTTWFTHNIIKCLYIAIFYFKLHLTPFRYPSDEVLSQLYQEHLQWSKFKLSVLQDSLDKVHKTMIATKPQFLKGHCGWVPSKVKPHLAVRGEYNECLGCSDPLHMHSEQRECHEGACVLRSSAVRSKSPLLRSRPVSLGCIKWTLTVTLRTISVINSLKVIWHYVVILCLR